MENNKVAVSNFEQASKIYADRLMNPSNNTHLLQQEAKPDTVEINGQVKTAEQPLSKKKKFAIAAATAAATAAVFAFASNLKKGRIVAPNVAPKFNHEPFLKDFPNIKQLDKTISETIKDVKLDYGFSDKLKTADELKTALEPYIDSWSLDDIADRAAKNDNFRNNLRVLTGKNFTGYDSNGNLIKVPYGFFLDERNFVKIDNASFESFIKMTQKGSSDGVSPYDIAGIVSKYKGDYQDASRFLALGKLINDELEKLPCNSTTINFFNIFRDNPEINFRDAANFLKSLKKGTLENDYVATWTLERLLGDKDVNIKSLTKFYNSLNDRVVERINLGTLSNLVDDSDIDLKEASQKLSSIPEETLKKLKSSDDVITYLRFEDFLGKKNINELSQAEKRKLMNKLVKNNSASFSFSSDLAPIIPKNQEEYCALLSKLARSIGIDTKPLSAQDKKFFEESLSRLDGSIKKVDFDKASISLKISRQDFIDSVSKQMEKLDDLEKRKVMDYFGFEIVDGKLRGYPINLNNGEKLAEISNKKTKKVIENIRPLVVDFSEHNPIIVAGADKAFEKDLNDILKGLPELRSMIGKAQHETHAYSLDKHTLKVLQGVVSDPRFASLPAEDKKVLSIASLLHDITKAEGLRDPMHPMESAFDAYYIIQKMKLPEEQQLKIYELIKSHNWLDRLNHPKNTPADVQRIAQDIAFDARHTNTFELAKILSKADMKAVKKDSSFFKRHEKTLDEMSATVDKYLKRIQDSQIVLPQTVIPKASQIKNGVIKEADGIKNTVIYMDKADDNLELLGFEKGTTKDNWRALVHALEYDSQMQKFNTFSTIDTEALLSTSYIDPKSYKVFRKQGLILDVNTNDIHAGYCSDFGTGCGKSIELLKSDYLFNGQRKTNGVEKWAWREDRTEYRDYIPNLIKSKMNINDDEYSKLIEKIQGCKSLTDIEKVDSDFAKALKETFSEMESKKRRGGRQYNEMLISRPKIQGVFAYDKPYHKIPEFLRKYAQENDLPIIIFGAA